MDLVVLAVGNRLKGDDGIGLYAGRLLQEKGFDVIFCESMPENFLGKIKSKKALLVDAADIEEDFLITEELADVPVVSTHGMSLVLMRRFLEEKGVELIVGAIKPESTGFEEKLSLKAKIRARGLVESVINEFRDS